MKLKALVGLGTFALIVTALGPVGCGADVDTDYPTNRNRNREIYNKPGAQNRDSLFGEGGLELFGGKKNNGGGGSGIAVNSFLWRASLDTVSFMPLASADPFGGVIITDWFTPPEQPSERFKVTVYILDRDLRSDGLKVSVFRQVREGAGTWIDAGVKPETSGNFENQILTRARQLRLASLNAAR
jgi:hypothetical protein